MWAVRGMKHNSCAPGICPICGPYRFMAAPYEVPDINIACIQSHFGCCYVIQSAKSPFLSASALLHVYFLMFVIFLIAAAVCSIIVGSF